MRILSLLARHGTSQYAAAPQKIKNLFYNLLPKVDHELIIIDNALEPGMMEKTPDGIVLGASNEYGEFTAWQKGIDHYWDALDSYDLINLATSAFDNLYTAYLDRFNESMLSHICSRPRAVGHIDAYERRIAIGSYESRHWLRTSFIMIPPLELKKLGTLVSITSGKHIFTSNPESPFQEKDGINKTYQEYLLAWLTGVDLPPDDRWHSCFRLTHETMPRFISKATAIMNEHMFSIRLRRQGCTLIDATWLDSMSKDKRVPSKIPSWEEQLSQRDTDSIHARTALASSATGRLLPKKDS